jgi:hypothetical protein
MADGCGFAVSAVPPQALSRQQRSRMSGVGVRIIVLSPFKMKWFGIMDGKSLTERSNMFNVI